MEGGGWKGELSALHHAMSAVGGGGFPSFHAGLAGPGRAFANFESR